MNKQRLTSIITIAAALAVSFSLQACNTVAGVGKDVSSGADAVTNSAEQSKTY